MALDMRRKQSGHPMWTVAIVLLIAAVASMGWWVFKSQRNSGNAQDATAAPAAGSLFSTPYHPPPPGRAGTPSAKGRAREAGASDRSGGDDAQAAPATHGGSGEKSAARDLTPRGDAAGAPAGPTGPVDPSIGATYDASNVDVRAPKLLTPLVYAAVPPEARREIPAEAIQIVVNEDGTVDSVKATFTAATVGQNLLLTSALSVAKTWRFNPAIKNGRPVKYRLLVPFSMFLDRG